MKYKKLLMCAVFCAAPFNALAAGSDYYVGILGGASFPQDLKSQISPGIAVTFDRNVNYNVGVFAGKEFGNFRGELEFMYRHNDTATTVDDGVNRDTTTVAIPYYSGMVNGYYDWRNNTQFTPYVGVGAGLFLAEPRDFTTAHFSATADDKELFGCQLMAGVNAAVTERISVGVGYRFVTAPTAQEMFAPTHETYASVAFRF